MKRVAAAAFAVLVTAPAFVALAAAIAGAATMDGALAAHALLAVLTVALAIGMRALAPRRQP